MGRPEKSQSVALLVLAAGASTRMRGHDKLLELVSGVPLLTQISTSAAATGLPVFVTLPPDAMPRVAALAGLDVKIIRVADASTGMAASLRAFGRGSAPDADGVMVILADMPEITTDDLQSLVRAFDLGNGKSVVRATDSAGRPGHPVIFPTRLVARFALLSGDQGARDILADEEINYVALPDTHATTDLDTPEEWINWRAQDDIDD